MKKPERKLEELEKEFWASLFFKMVESELDERHARVEKINLCNEARKNKAKANHQVYRDIAGRLIANNPRLRNATVSHMAVLVRREFTNQGSIPPSKRTIERALQQKTLKV